MPRLQPGGSSWKQCGMAVDKPHLSLDEVEAAGVCRTEHQRGGKERAEQAALEPSAGR